MRRVNADALTKALGKWIEAHYTDTFTGADAGSEFAYMIGCAAIDTNPTVSAQPEIIRCEDCKWYGRADKRRFYRGMDCLQKRIDTIVPDRDFCSKAERRTDDGE